MINYSNKLDEGIAINDTTPIETQNDETPIKTQSIKVDNINLVRGRDILLIDDVTTSGSTLLAGEILLTLLVLKVSC